MSYHDEFNELEKRLRQSKPKTEPLPPALKRQMRQELMEQMTMNESRFSFRKLGMALGGLILLIGIPVFFWLAQMSIGTGEVPGAAPDNSPVETTRPSPTRAVVVEGEPVLVPQVEETEDKAWVISTDIPQGQTVSRYTMINVTLGYELVSLSEADLVVKLFDGPRGVLSFQSRVSGPQGTVVIPLSLSKLEEVSGSSVYLELQIILQEPDQVGGQLPYVDFVEGWTVDLTAEPEMTTAEIVRVGKPSAVVEEGFPEGAVVEVELTTAYTLSGYEEALLVVGFEYEEANGQAGGLDVHAIAMGSGEMTSVLRLAGNLFDARGEAVEGMNFFARINHYDETAGEWVNLYPGNVALMDAERNLPYPYIRDSFVIHSAAWAEDATGKAVLNVVMGYNLEGQETAEILINATGADGVVLGSETAVIEAGQELLTIPIVIDKVELADDPIVMVSAVLTAGEIVIEDELQTVYQSQMTAGETNGQGEIWIISTNVVTRTTENGIEANIILVVGYDLSSEYVDGLIAFSNQYSELTNGGGSGGGGGSQNQIAPGTGTTSFVSGFKTNTSWVDARDMLNGMQIYLKLFGNTSEGEQVLIGELSKIGID